MSSAISQPKSNFRYCSVGSHSSGKSWNLKNFKNLNVRQKHVDSLENVQTCRSFEIGFLRRSNVEEVSFQNVSSLTILFLLINRYLSNTMSEPAQVVPDIDEGSSGDTKDGFESSSRLRQPELELRLTKYRDNVNNKEPRVTLTRESLTQPPIRRISEDARPLTAAEILAHRHLLNVT